MRSIFKQQLFIYVLDNPKTRGCHKILTLNHSVLTISNLSSSISLRSNFLADTAVLEAEDFTWTRIKPHNWFCKSEVLQSFSDSTLKCFTVASKKQRIKLAIPNTFNKIFLIFEV